jgi:hypothetical protein
VLKHPLIINKLIHQCINATSSCLFLVASTDLYDVQNIFPQYTGLYISDICGCLCFTTGFYTVYSIISVQYKLNNVKEPPSLKYTLFITVVMVWIGFILCQALQHSTNEYKFQLVKYLWTGASFLLLGITFFLAVYLLRRRVRSAAKMQGSGAINSFAVSEGLRKVTQLAIYVVLLSIAGISAFCVLVFVIEWKHFSESGVRNRRDHYSPDPVSYVLSFSIALIYWFSFQELYILTAIPCLRWFNYVEKLAQNGAQSSQAVKPHSNPIILKAEQNYSLQINTASPVK